MVDSSALAFYHNYSSSVVKNVISFSYSECGLRHSQLILKYYASVQTKLYLLLLSLTETYILKALLGMLNHNGIPCRIQVFQIFDQ